MEDCNSNTPTGESGQVGNDGCPTHDQMKKQWAWLEATYGKGALN